MSGANTTYQENTGGKPGQPAGSPLERAAERSAPRNWLRRGRPSRRERFVTRYPPRILESDRGRRYRCFAIARRTRGSKGRGAHPHPRRVDGEAQAEADEPRVVV